VTIGLKKRTAEERAAGLLFSETFRSRDAVERGGATIVGTGTTFSTAGVAFSGSGNLLYNVSGAKIIRAAMTIVIEFTLGFVGNDGVLHYSFDVTTAAGAGRCAITKDAANAIVVTMGSTVVLTVAYATWNAALVAGKNTLIVSTTTGATTAWLNGTSIGTSATAWTLSPAVTLFAVGSSYAGATRWTGTISRFEIYGNVCTAVDEPYLRAGTLISKLDDYLVCVPGTSYYKRVSDGLYVTDVLEKAGITQALMGSDGATAAQFPKVAREAGLVRGFSFDGGDQINVGDLAAFSAAGVDKPFSVAMIAQVDDFSAALALLTKAASLTVGEWALYVLATGLLQFLTIDNSAGANRGRAAGSVAMKKGLLQVVIATYAGTGVVGGFAIYLGGVRVDSANITNGTYTSMADTATDVLVGAGLSTGAVASQLNGKSALPEIFDYCLSPLQAKALTARLLRQSRVA